MLTPHQLAVLISPASIAARYAIQGLIVLRSPHAKHARWARSLKLHTRPPGRAASPPPPPSRRPSRRARYVLAGRRPSGPSRRRNCAPRRADGRARAIGSAAGPQAETEHCAHRRRGRRQAHRSRPVARPRLAASRRTRTRNLRRRAGALRSGSGKGNGWSRLSNVTSISGARTPAIRPELWPPTRRWRHIGAGWGSLRDGMAMAAIRLLRLSRSSALG